MTRERGAAAPSTGQAARHALAGRPAGRYKSGMRRPTRLGLAAALVLLAALGAYAAYWRIAAGRLADGVAEWARSLRAQNLDLSWQAIRVGGFPLAFRIELSGARLRNGAAAPAAELRVKRLSGSARPWNFRAWRLLAPEGLSATAGPAEGPLAELTAAAASGSLALGAEGGATLWLDLDKPGADVGVPLAARDADLWLILPPRPPQTHTERAIGIALKVRELTLPTVPAPFLNPVDEIAFGATVLGAIPAAPPRRAAASWRDAGGTFELDHFTLRWGMLRVTGSGTAALDAELQPIGGFSGAIEGYEQLMTALVAAGRMRAGDARLARLALAMLARAGPDGRPEIATSFTVQNGEMYLGPAKLGRAPRIAWQ